MFDDWAKIDDDVIHLTWFCERHHIVVFPSSHTTANYGRQKIIMFVVVYDYNLGAHRSVFPN